MQAKVRADQVRRGTESDDLSDLLPRCRSDKALVATARVFVEEARRREAEFVRLGLPPTFISDFQSVMDELDRAVNARNNSAHLRRKAQAGIETALTVGLDDIGELDVVVPNALLDDPVRVAQWRRARHIDGQGTSSPATATSSPATQIAAPPMASAMDPPTAATTSSPVVAIGEEVTAALVESAALPKAS